MISDISVHSYVSNKFPEYLPVLITYICLGLGLILLLLKVEN